MLRPEKKETLSYIMGFENVYFEFNLIQDYFNHMEKHFEAELKNIDQAYEDFLNEPKESKTINTEEDYLRLHFLKESFVDNFFMFETVYKKNFRNAQIIQLYSFVEHVLKEGCDRFADYKETNFCVDDLKGVNDIDKIKTFLKKSVKLDFSLLNPEWKFLDDFRQVRNIVVHHKNIIRNGDVRNNTDKRFNNIVSFSKGHFSIKPYSLSDNWFEIVFDEPQFFIKIIDNIESLLTKIGKQEMILD